MKHAASVDAPAVAPIGGALSPRRFFAGLTGITVFALAWRVGYILLVTIKENGKFYDAFWYQVTANGIVQGQFFRVPFGYGPTAAHPPLTSLVLGAVTLPFGVHPGTGLERMTMAVLGAGVVLCVGLLGRAVAGGWVGLVAAGVAALAPNFWIPNGIVMSETLAMLLMALILLATIRVMRKPSWSSAIWLGVAVGAEVLVRAELILFVPALLVPAALAARQVSIARRLGLAGVAVLSMVVVLTPWTVRNLEAFQDPTYISTGFGNALLGSNCPGTYSGPGLGFWDIHCLPQDAKGDESVVSSEEQHTAIEYAKHHVGRLPIVVLARIGRLWDVYEPLQMVQIDVNEGRPAPAAFAGLLVYYALVPLGVAGVVILRRRRIRQWFLIVPAGVLTVISALFYGSVRFRAPFEVCLVVLAAPALILLAQWSAKQIRGRGDDVRPPAHERGASRPLVGS